MGWTAWRVVMLSDWVHGEFGQQWVEWAKAAFLIRCCRWLGDNMHAIRDARRDRYF
jgi:hypothetical protein